FSLPAWREPLWRRLVFSCRCMYLRSFRHPGLNVIATILSLKPLLTAPPLLRPARSVAQREGAIPFDVANVELGHKGTECSFDAIIKKYNLADPALQRLAPIVRGADTDAKDLTPESRGLEAIAEGFRLVYQNDHELLERESSVYDALYAYCQQIEQSRSGGVKN